MNRHAGKIIQSGWPNYNIHFFFEWLIFTTPFLIKIISKYCLHQTRYCLGFWRIILSHSTVRISYRCDIYDHFYVGAVQWWITTCNIFVNLRRHLFPDLGVSPFFIFLFSLCNVQNRTLYSDRLFSAVPLHASVLSRDLIEMTIGLDCPSSYIQINYKPVKSLLSFFRHCFASIRLDATKNKKMA